MHARYFESLPYLYERDLARELALQHPHHTCSIEPRDLCALPACVRNFVVAAGLADHSQATNARVVWSAMQLRSSPQAKWMSVECEQVSFFRQPVRLALMRSKLAGIVPFTGYDRYRDAQGQMSINLAGRLPLRRAHGSHMDDSALVTYLSEAMLLPVLFVDPRLQWQPLDEHAARAIIHHGGRCVAGVFRFDPAHAWVRFDSHDRWRDGREPTRARWSAEVSQFAWHKGLRVPSEARAWWHAGEDDFLYMRGKIESVSYDVTDARVMVRPAWRGACSTSVWARAAPGGLDDVQEDSDRARLLGAR